MEEPFIDSMRIVAMRACEPGVRWGSEIWLDLQRADRQHAGGFGMEVCSQPWVTANSRAASRDANVVSNLNTRQ